MSAISEDQLVLQFFSSPNLVWPDMAADHRAAERITAYLGALSTRGECPLVLPRRDAVGQPVVVYVVCWDLPHAGRMRPLLQAAVADYLSPFDGRVAKLRADDPVEDSLLKLAGSGTTFVLRPTVQSEGRLVIALERLVRSLRGQPRRNPVLPRPIGRMLREFGVALAAGAADQSASVLQEIERAGGISHENVTFLQIQRLWRLGRDQELLAHGSLPTLVHTEPPVTVRAAVLSAWGRRNLGEEESRDLDLAVRRLANEAIDVAMLVDEVVAPSLDADGLSVGAVVALARDDSRLASALLANDELPSLFKPRLKQLLSAALDQDQGPTQIADTPQDQSSTPPEPTSSSLPDSWLTWLARLEEGVPTAPAIELIESWEPAWKVDDELGQAIDDLSDFATDALLAGVAVFLDTADPRHPAPRTARALVRRYLIEERFGPADLSALAALVAIYLSSAPGEQDYESLLEEIAGFAPQWSSVASSAQALDLADTVVCGPRVAPRAQAQFVSAVLAPLHAQRQRLTGGLRSLAAMITGDAELEWDWAVGAVKEHEAETSLPTELNVLIYSLDSGTLARVAASLRDQYPTITVHRSSDKVGTPSLRQHSRNADLLAIATGRATHAATGFITDHAEGKILYPDGCGAASMLRVIEAALEELSITS